MLTLRRPRSGSRRRGAAIALALVLLAALAPGAAAWGNGGDNGNGYGTHDWILDQSFELLKSRGIDIAWVDRKVALLATDDPDTVEVAKDPSRGIEHVYRETGLRGGAIHRITEHYAAMIRLYREGADAKAAGNLTTAASKFKAASWNLGMLAHFYGDILQPYHTAYAAMTKDSDHGEYERLVSIKTRAITDSPSWSVRASGVNWVVEDIDNIRTRAVDAAAYSRARYGSLQAAFAPTQSITSTVSSITRELLVRASGDLADVVASIPKGVGNPPQVASLSVRMRWRGTKKGETQQIIYATVKDVNGDPVEGVQVDVAWPLDSGGTKKVRFWTDPTGNRLYKGTVGSFAYMTHRTVTASITTDGSTISKNTWFYTTRRLADGSTGFKVTVNDRTVQAGQTVTATARAINTSGNPIVGLQVYFTWDLGSREFTTKAYTGSTGKARSSITIESSTSRSTLYVRTKTSAYSINRYSTASFYRTD